MFKMVKISFLGDVMCEYEQAEASWNDFNSIFAELKKFFSNSDYVVANLETPIAGKDFDPPRKYSFNAPIEFAAAIQEAGVNLVSTANNHCLDRGIEGLLNTIKALDDLKLAHIGTAATKDEKSTLLKDFNGIKIGFVAHTYGTNAFANHCYLSRKEHYMVSLLQRQENGGVIDKFFDKYQKSILAKVYRRIVYPLIHPFNCQVPIYERISSSYNYKKRIKLEINALKKEGADYIIALTHIGGQYNTKPTRYTKKTVEWLIRCGVGTVICNHEHVVHGYYGKRLNESIFAAYCLGNFTSTSGVLHEPFNKRSEYNIIVNLYLFKSQGIAKIDKVTFSIVKSILSENRGVKSVLLYDLIDQCDESNEKEKLLSDNLAIVNSFLGERYSSIPLLVEYTIPSVT